jgi:hypothetical protein
MVALDDVITNTFSVGHREHVDRLHVKKNVEQIGEQQ